MQATRQEGADVSAVLGVLRRRFLIVLISVIALAGAAYVFAQGQEERYSSSSQVLLRSSSSGPTSVNYGAPIPESSSDLESLALSGAVQSRATATLRKKLESARAQQAVGAVNATAEEQSAIIDLEAIDRSPEVAAMTANSVASAIVNTRRDGSLARVRSARRSVQRQIQTRRSAGPAAVAELAALRSQLAQLGQAEAVIDGDAEIVRRAGVPSTPSEPRPQRSALIGGFVGLLLGLALAFAREQIDRRVRTADGLQDAFGLPVLASVPRSRSLGTGREERKRLPQVEAEAFQMLRANLRHLKGTEEPRVIVVTSTGPAEGKTTVALNLARADASIGQRVLLIEADLRRPSLGKILGNNEARGFGAYLVDRRIEVADVTREVSLSPSSNGPGPESVMDVIFAGEPPANPGGAINSPRMAEILSWARESYDLVVIDTSPAGSVADAIPLMTRADAVVVVGRVGKLNSRQANKVREQLERVGAPTLGVVANFVPSGEEAYAYGY